MVEREIKRVPPFVASKVGFYMALIYGLITGVLSLIQVMAFKRPANVQFPMVFTFPADLPGALAALLFYLICLCAAAYIFAGIAALFYNGAAKIRGGLKVEVE